MCRSKCRKTVCTTHQAMAPSRHNSSEPEERERVGGARGANTTPTVRNIIGHFRSFLDSSFSSLHDFPYNHSRPRPCMNPSVLIDGLSV